MTVREKIKEIKNTDVLSFGLILNDYISEYLIEDYLFLSNELLDKEVLKIKKYNDPLYIELVLKDKENK